jgi:hypothetical protein
VTTRYAAEWLLAFAATQAIEMPIYARVLAPPGRAAKAFVPSALTHPVIWFALAPHWPGSYPAMLAVAEAFAVVAEAAVLGAFRARRPLAWSIVSNAASFGAELLLESALGGLR